LARFVGYTGEILDFGVGLRLANSGAQRKITDYYKQDKKSITKNDHKTRHTTRQETNERHTNKTRNTRQSATSANHAKP
jgi:hypothetical protein